MLPATTASGERVVLKLAFPHHESRQEPDALRRWSGRGAVRLLDHDPGSGALLLERCLPGTPLFEIGPEAAVDALVELLPSLWVSADGFDTLADEAAWWAGYLPQRWDGAGRPFPRLLLDAALTALRELPGSQGPPVLTHQDLHAGNVLRSQRQPWLAIDPKPLAAEREFSLAPIVRGRELGHSREAVVSRLDRLSTALGLERERARRWALAQTVAWSIEGDVVVPGHVDVASWLHQA